MPKSDPKERITFYLDAPLKQQIEASADKRGQTLSIWITRACQAHLSPKEPVACSK